MKEFSYKMQDQYHAVLNHIRNEGYIVDNDRTGVGTKKMFGQFMKFDACEDNFPILTSKYVHFRSIVVELLWMLSGNDNTNYLKKHGVTIWDEWADSDGSLNGVYGKQWRSWPKAATRSTQRARMLIDQYGSIDSAKDDGWQFLYRDTEFKENIFYKWDNSIDQVKSLIETIKNNPNDRRQLVTAWNVEKIDEMNLPPCHHTWQTYVEEENISDDELYERYLEKFNNQLEE